MKKTLLSVASSVAFAAVVALVGCSAPTTVSSDTIESISAPKVTAKTYAGVVRLTWNVVKGAQGYEIYKDGDFIRSVTNCEYMDVAGPTNNLVDGVKYTYDVVAVPKSNYAQQQRAVYIKENQTSVTVKAKVPTPEEFEAEYKSYFDKFTAEKTEFKTERISVKGTPNYWDTEDCVVVTAPTLPEFGYVVKYYVDAPAPFAKDESTSGTIDAFTFTENKATNIYSGLVLGAGDVKTYVEVIPLSPLYPITRFDSNDLSISKFDAFTNTTNLNAWYVSDTKIRFEWTPAQSSKGVYYAPAGYSVYGRLDSGSVKGDYEKVEGEVKVLNPGDVATDENGTTYVVTETKYYIEGTVVKGEPQKRYFITLCVDGNYESWWITDGGKYEFTTVKGVNAGLYVTDLTASVFTDGKTVRVSFTPVVDTDSTSMYTVYRTNKNDKSVEKIGEVKEGTFTSVYDGNIEEKVLFYVDDTTVDTTVDYSYVVYRQINGAFEKASSTTDVNKSAAAADGAIEVLKMAVDKDLIENDVLITITVNDPADSFILYRAEYVANDGIVLGDYVAVKGGEVDNEGKKWVDTTAYNNTTYYVLDSNVPNGDYYYKVVFSGKDKTSSQSITHIKNVGSNDVEEPVYVKWTGGSVVVEDVYLKDSENFKDIYKYEYKILARKETVERTQSDKSYTVSKVQAGDIKPTEVNYTLLTSTYKYDYHRGEYKPGTYEYIYYTGYRNDSFKFDTGNGVGLDYDFGYNDDRRYNGIDANKAYVHGSVNYSLTTGNGLESVIVLVSKTNTKSGKTECKIATIYDKYN